MLCQSESPLNGDHYNLVGHIRGGRRQASGTCPRQSAHSIASAMYADARVAKMSAWIEPAKTPSAMIGKGTTKGTKNVSTATVSSSARTFPKSRKLKLNGFVKSSRMLMGSRVGVGFT